MPLKQVYARSWNRFLTPELAIAIELVGRSHQFVFDGHEVTVELPSEYDDTDLGTKTTKRASVYGWQTIDGVLVPRMVGIESVDVLVDIGESIAIPDEVLSRSPNAHDVLTEEKQAELTSYANSYGPIAEAAFDLWLRTLRWKSNKGSIGRPVISGPKSGWTTYLTEQTTGHRFWAASVVFEVSGQAISLQQWDSAENALQAGDMPPVYYDLLFDAEEHLKHEDLRRSVVDAAVACESYMRLRIRASITSGIIDTKMLEYADETTVRPLINTFFPRTLSSQGKATFENLRSSLHKLFDSRNEILHSGVKDNLTLRMCEEYLDAARKLITIF